MRWSARLRELLVLGWLPRCGLCRCLVERRGFCSADCERDFICSMWATWFVASM